MANDVFFSTNPSDFTRLEGLYVAERPQTGFIRGVNLSTASYGGLTVRGPSGPQFISDPARFVEVYGGRDRGSGGPLASEVWASLINKPVFGFYVDRVVAADAVAADLEVEEGVDGLGLAVMKITASSKGLWGGDVSVRVDDASDADADHFNLVVKYLGVDRVFENLNIKTAADDNLAIVTGDDIGLTITLTKLADGRPATFSTITEVDWIAKDDADNFMALGTVLSAYSSTAASDGTPVSADYLSSITRMAALQGVSIVLMAGASVDQTAMNNQIVIEQASVSDRVFLTWSGVHGQSASAVIASLATDITTRNDRTVYTHNSPKTLDPQTGLKIQRGGHEWMASILQNNDVDIHPGARQTADQLAGISELTDETITRSELILLRDAGISTLEKLPGLFLFRSAVTTDLTTGKTEITRRRSADFLQLSAAEKLREFVKGKNTIEARALIAGLLVGFSQSLRDQGRIIEDFAIDQESVNTPTQRAAGVEKILWRVKLIGHILHLVLETEISTGVVIEAAA